MVQNGISNGKMNTRPQNMAGRKRGVITTYKRKNKHLPEPEQIEAKKLKWRDYGLEWIKTPFVLSLCALTKS